MLLSLYFISILALFSSPILAKRKLSATSLVTCMQNSQITPSHFNVTFNPDDRSLRYSLDLTTEISNYVTAHIQVYAYGFLIIEKDIDMCSLGWKQFCPIYPGSLQVDSIEYISEEYTKQIPGIAYQVPDIDAVVKVIVKDRDSGLQLSCLQSNFSNGKTISQTGVKWATAVIAGLGLVIAALLSTFGNSNAASHISANSVSLFLYFQSVVIVSMQAVERVPPIASSWSENLAWSMGLIEIKFMQQIFRWYIQSTGGTPTTYFIGVTKQILVQRAKRSLDYIDGIIKRSIDYGLHSNQNLIVLRGIKRIGYNTKIEPTSIVATGFTWFVLIGYLLVVLLVLLKSALVLYSRHKKGNNNKFNFIKGNFNNILKGSILRYIYIGSTQLIIFSLWEFTQNDSPAMIVLAVLFIILLLSVLLLSFYKTLRIGRLSTRKFNNPSALLYGDQKVLDKYGFCYTIFHANKYWFGIVLLGYNVFKAIFIAFCQSAGKVSVLPVFIIDLFYTIFLIYESPYLNKPTNIINFMMSIVTTINSFLFLFFSDLFGQSAPVASIMGWVFFILNAAFSLILLILVLVFIILSISSKNPDARFQPAKDDRFSFQKQEKGNYENNYIPDEKNQNGELNALGIAAQDHSQDWENQMYKLNNIQENSPNDNLTPQFNNPDEIFQSESSSSSLYNEKESVGFGSKLKNNLFRKLSKKKSTKSRKSNSSTNKNITRISDTLVDDDDLSDEKRNEDYDELREVNNPYNLNDGNHRRMDSSYSSVSNNNPTNTKGFI
ncbi:unnamed protein product [Candida verbasci]|uniref:ML-like domain-containing protein n=1 Tax=Candida verbasci TaxID=1227364 RepID=A0A9W4XAM7_9ASCO|nr:unnamed protein product [Candida verbasci]